MKFRPFAGPASQAFALFDVWVFTADVVTHVEF